MTKRLDDHTVPLNKNQLGQRIIRLVSDNGTESYPLPDSGSLVVGRGTDSQLTIDHESVSRRHCRVHLGDFIELEDLGSTNGTSISGQTLVVGQKRRWPLGVAANVGNVIAIIEGSDHYSSDSSGVRKDDEHVVVAGSELQAILDLARTIARGDIAVLIVGETGVGKEVMAEFIHQNSERSGRPFVRINCAALPEALLESELFGHERGAFTGASYAKPGLLEVADSGTVLLDEIGEMPLALQAKLLRVVENRKVYRVGGRTVKHVDVRFISATNRHPDRLTEEKSMREDLFFRLAGITLEIPPLRKRRDEILPLAERFLSRFSAKRGAAARLSREALEALRNYDWPGNVRELRNVMERAALVSGDGIIEEHHLYLPRAREALSTRVFRPEQQSGADHQYQAAGAGPLKDHLRTAEVDRIQLVLSNCRGNQTQAAKILGISRRTLVRRMRDLQMDRPRAGRSGHSES